MLLSSWFGRVSFYTMLKSICPSLPGFLFRLVVGFPRYEATCPFPTSDARVTFFIFIFNDISMF